jgi:glycosyltransferase involved in cell wall biosynthesis
MNQTISILIPVYNSGKYVGKCLESLIKQTYNNIEIITLNDGSTDNSLEILNKYAKKDSRIKVFSKDNEKNISKTRNYLLSLNHNNYFIFVDSDDIVKKNYVKILYENLINNDADLSICGSRLQLFYQPILRNFATKKLIYNNYSNAIEDMILGKNLHFMLWNRIYKTNLAKDLKFDENVLFGEDLIFNVLYTKKCKKIVFTNIPLYHYLMRKNSEMHKKFSYKNITFTQGLQNLIAKEDDYKIKNSLKFWLFLTCCYYIHILNKNKTKNNELIKIYITLAKQNKVEINDYRVRKAYKFLYKIANNLYTS